MAEESDDEWSLHDLDRVPEPIGDVPLSPRTYGRSTIGLSSRRSSGGFMEGGSSSSSLRHLPETPSGSTRRFQRRGWGSTAGGSGGTNGPPGSNANNTSPSPPPSFNLQAVMSFPPMSEEQIALSNSMEQLRRTSTNSMWSESRSPGSATSTLKPAAQQLHHHGSFSDAQIATGGQSLTGNSLTGGSLPAYLDESNLEGGDYGFDEEEDNISFGKAPPMPLHKNSFKHHATTQQSVMSGLTTQQRARFENLGAATRNRLDTGGSGSSRKHGDLSENSERPESRRRLGSVEVGSDSSFVDETDHGPGDEDTEAGDSTTIDTHKVFVLWGGFELPYWLVSWLPSVHRISTLVVTRAPCFICWGFRQPTDRSILARLNVLVTFMAVIQITSAVFLASVSWNKPEDDAITNLTDEEEYARSTRGPVLFNVWTTNVYIYFTGMLALINFFSALLTIRVIRNVNLVGAIRYLWVLLWVLPLQFQSNIGLFDYFRVTDVWIKHYWRDSSMSWFRGRFCDPPETADFECTIPRGNNATELRWCMENYNATNCSRIRNNAQSDMEKWILSFYYLNASVGLVLICLLVLTVNILEHIISKPLVQKSRESNVPAWMSLPIVSCVAFGLLFAFSNTSVLNTRTDSEATFIGPLFLVTAALFFMAAMNGWYISAKSVMNTRHKRNKLIAIWVFIIMMVCILVLLTTIFAICIAFSVSLVEVPISPSQRGRIACFLDESGSCSNCDDDTADVRCPEWSIADVTKVIQTQAKTSASLAAMLMLYALSALRFGIGLRTHINLYQIEYV